MKICETCNKEHSGSYGSGRFCDSRCARSFSTKRNRKEISNRVRETYKEKRLNKTLDDFINEAHRKSETQYKKSKQRIWYFSKYPHVCVVCGYDRIVDVHHLGMLSETKLQAGLCPNHHKECHAKRTDYNKEQILAMRDALIA